MKLRQAKKVIKKITQGTVYRESTAVKALDRIRRSKRSK
jgi:hypothetical protein